MFCVEDTEAAQISQLFPLALDFIQKGVSDGNVNFAFSDSHL
jgi:hypothetical protein